ncbi:MAG: glycogen/starch synthase [Gemmatimonadota bacterium]|nr:glycogen/starch synthase [Gemmatimonadota bacterium]
MSSLSVAFLAAEIAPWFKVGGLGDIAASLPEALAREGVRVEVFVPLHRPVSGDPPEVGERVDEITFCLGEHSVSAAVRAGPSEGARLRFVEIPAFFDREGLYAGAEPYADDLGRWTAFCRAVLTLLRERDQPLPVILANDWHACPVLLDPGFSSPGERPGVVLAIHNLLYQGCFGAEEATRWGYGPNALADDHLNLLKTGILGADRIVTVSPGYAREILSPEYGGGLHEALRSRGKKLTGILNGIDEQEWNPRTDPALPGAYDAGDMSGREVCRRELARRCGFELDARRPIAGMVTRFAEQKGMDLVVDSVPEMLDLGFDLVVQGIGDPPLEDALRSLEEKFPERVRLFACYDAELARLVIAASDCLLIPSRYEPCGLNQMYAQRYGTLPVARRTGGLADTITDPRDTQDGVGTGFLFEDASSEALVSALARARDLLIDPPRHALFQMVAMERDFSWARSARSWISVLESAANDRCTSAGGRFSQGCAPS